MTLVAGFDFRDLGPDGGGWMQTDNQKLEIHRTEGGSAAGAEVAMARYPSHFLCSYKEKIKRQYVHLERSSYANKANDTQRVFQLEIVGFSAESRNANEDELRWYGEEVFRPIMQATNVPAFVVPKGFHDTTTYKPKNPNNYLASARSEIRLTDAELVAFAGVLGHQHMPAPDSHWDPGALDVERILRYAFPNNATPEEREAMLTFIIDCYELYLGVTRSQIMADKQLRTDVDYHTWLLTSGQKTPEQYRSWFAGMARSQGRIF